MANVTGLNIRECMNRIVEGSTVTVGTGKNAEEIQIVKKYRNYVLCKKNARLSDYTFCMTYEEFYQNSGTGL